MRERQEFWILRDAGVTVTQLALDAVAVEIAKMPVAVEPERVKRYFGRFGRTAS